MKARIHTVKLTVTFDKKCTTTHALREVRDTVHGEFYPTRRTDGEPGSYRVRNIARVRKPKLNRRKSIDPSWGDR